MNLFSRLFTKNDSDLDGTEFKSQFLITKNSALLDVRTLSEFRSGTILNAKNMDVMSPDFNTKASKLDDSKTYFVFCRSGNRSGNAVNIMKREGLKAFNLLGGIGAFPK
nr:rhodanese-like domain-containing protein [Pseudopedobacter sp.]